jgi:PAS domain S-box-containing protein
MKSLYPSPDDLSDELAFAADAAELGVWDLNPLTNQFRGNARLKAWFGLQPTDEVPLFLAMQAIASTDRKRVETAINEALRYESGGQYAIEYRLIHPQTGHERVVRAKGRATFGPDRVATRFNGILQDITEQHQAGQRQCESEQRFQAAIAAVQGILWTNNARGEMTGEQPGWAALTGQTYEQYQGYGWTSAVHPDDAQPTVAAWQEALRQSATFVFEHRVRTQTGNWEWFSIRAVPLLNPDGSIREWVGVHTNIEQQRRSEETLRASEAKFRSLIEEAPVAIGLFVGRELLIETPNQLFVDVVGRGPHIAGKPLGEVMPELVNQPFLQLLDEVFTTGQTYQDLGAPVEIIRNGVSERRYFNVTFSPLFNEAGEVYAILDISVDVTQQVLAQQQLAASDLKFRSLIENAPVATGLYVGPGLVVELANEMMLGYWGKGPNVIGKPLAEALPEIEGQPFLGLLHDILQTGQTYQSRAAPADLVVGGVLGTYYFDYTYKPLFDDTGKVYGILNMAVDVTAEVLARRRIEEAETVLRGAIELAQLVTWELDIERGTMSYSPRFMEWLGFSENTKPLDAAYDPLPDGYRQSVSARMEAAWQPGSTGYYDNEHPIINCLTGQVRIIHAQAQVRYDVGGKPTHLIGTAQDITEQRRIRQELERQVGERTWQLQNLVRDLERTNSNLQQFAYVASHDLQEPLRKIRSFANLLTEQYRIPLGNGGDLIDRIQAAAQRMSVLISDLLAYSRIETRQETGRQVALNDVLIDALLDFDLRIQETGASVEVGTLPTVWGDALQLGQLFQNLLGNALKFGRPDVPPHIQVRSAEVAATELPATVSPARASAHYHRIDVVDNGIGFDPKYADRIFQVFQRLHGRSQYSGTGIGLAICEKVALNHGGAITANSQPGKGATFSVYLPMGD